jgi:predicted AAA+ superfamily ATPase
MEEIQRLFLSCGGFPFRVEALLNDLAEERPFASSVEMQVFDDVLFYEIGRRRLDRNIALEVVGRLGAIGASAASYEGFAKPLTITKDTARKYLDALGDAFLLATVSSYDMSRGRVAPKKDRKFLWADPALGELPAWLRQGEPLAEAARAEASVGVELLRRYEARLFEGLSAPRNVFTWKSTSGNELDFLVIDKSRKLVLPVEVKYQETISDWDFQVIERAFGKGILVTKATARQRPKAHARPLADFLMGPSVTEPAKTHPLTG